VRDFLATMGRSAGPGRSEGRRDVEVSAAASGGVAELIERAESVSALRELLAGVRSSSKGRLVLVRGEAGVGKTALLRGFCDALDKPVVVRCGPPVRWDHCWMSPRWLAASSRSWSRA
jgi:hypothetical protein